MMKIYISGKMGESPLSDETKDKFKRAEFYLREDGGWFVYNPASDVVQEALRQHIKEVGDMRGHILTPIEVYAEVLLIDLNAIAQCDAIYMLPDWKESPGARAEKEFAVACDKIVIYGTMKEICEDRYDLVNLGASQRLRNCMAAIGITNIEDCTQHAKTDFLKLRNFGKKTMKELDKLMAENGFEYRKDYKPIKI